MTSEASTHHPLRYAISRVMRKRSRARLALLLASALVLLLPVGAASASTVQPQAWTSECAWNAASDYWAVSLPGKTDLNFYAVPCVFHSGSSVYATVELAWSESELPPVGSGHKFDGFKVRANLDVRPNGGSDTIFEYKDCDFTNAVNADWAENATCTTPTYNGYDSSFDYSGDGWVSYDIDNDGKSWQPTRQLYGSPLIH